MNDKCYEFKTKVPYSWLDRCSNNGYERYTDDEGNRRYVDNDVISGEMPFRPCNKCKEYPTEEGHDACLGTLGNVINACCGHGNREGYIQFDNGITVRGHFTIEISTPINNGGIKCEHFMK